MATKLLRLPKEKLSLYKEEAWKKRISLNAWFLLLAEESVGGPKAIRIPKEPKQPRDADAVRSVAKSNVQVITETDHAPKPLTMAEAHKKLQHEKAQQKPFTIPE